MQLRLAGFTVDGLGQVGRRVHDLYADGSSDAERLRRLCDDDYVLLLAKAVTGDLGGKVGVAPRVFLKKLVGDVLDRVDQFPDFDPRRDYRLTIVNTELTDIERNARAAATVDDIELKLP